MIRFRFILYRLSFRYDYHTLEATCMLKVACNSGFKQRVAADFPTPGNSSLAGIVNAARQFYVRRASAIPLLILCRPPLRQ
jgi:hypothetical protein